MASLRRRVPHVQSLFLLLAVVCPAEAVAQTQYFPPRGDAWERRSATAVGLDSARVAEAVAFAIASESTAPRDLLANHRRGFGREPHGEAVGPFKERGEATGMIVRNGYIVAEWGDPHRVDVTFSVTKSFVSTAVGLAYDRGLIRDVHDAVAPYIAPVVALVGAPGAAALVEVPRAGAPPGEGVAYDAFEVLEPFASDHARRITWDHLLRQTSDWQGTLWGKPDWADRPRGEHAEWRARARHEPGHVYMYNDVRVNLLALAALDVWRRPLPQVLREHVMEPIGASGTWRWYGYDNSWVVLDGQLVQSVSGGAHWGGGMLSLSFGVADPTGGAVGPAQWLTPDLDDAAHELVSELRMRGVLWRGDRRRSAPLVVLDAASVPRPGIDDEGDVRGRRLDP
jgi:CubicO group peptidase (beta-lactamase class C family)